MKKKLFAFALAAAVLLAAAGLVLPGGAKQTASAADAPAGWPFLLGATRGQANQPVPYMDYTFGDNPGAVPLDGAVHNCPLPETFAQFETLPDSDHPDGIAYIWIYDDSDNVYFVLDWTSDNTFDAGDDFFTIYIQDGFGLKAYTQHTEPVGGKYGVSIFAVTDIADYLHMWYAVAVPKADLKAQTLKVGFELYGTVSVWGDVGWTGGFAPYWAKPGAPVDFAFDYEVYSDFVFDHIAFLLAYDDSADLGEFLNYYGGIYDGEFFNWNYYEGYDGPIEILDWNIFEAGGGWDDTIGEDIPGTGTEALTYTFDEAGTYKAAVVIYFISSYIGEGAEGIADIEYGNRWSVPVLSAEVTVSDTKPADVCMITAPQSIAGGYPTLYQALAAAKTADAPVTVSLLKDITVETGLTVTDSDITFALNGHDLTVANPAGGNALTLRNSSVDYKGAGNFTVQYKHNNGGAGIYAAEGENSARVTALEILGGDGYGIDCGGADLVFTGDITADPIDGDNTLLYTSNAEAIINASFSYTGNKTFYGIFADGYSNVIMNGDLNVTATAVEAFYATVTVNGDVSTTNDYFCISVYWYASVTVNGAVTVESDYYYFYIGDDANKGAAEITEPTTKENYFTYTDGASTVWVFDPDCHVAPVITTASLSGGTIGAAFSAALAASGTGPIRWTLESGSLPGGLKLSALGVISGTPTASGTFAFTVKAANGGGGDTKEFTIVIAAAPVTPPDDKTPPTDTTPGGDSNIKPSKKGCKKNGGLFNALGIAGLGIVSVVIRKKKGV